MRHLDQFHVSPCISGHIENMMGPKWIQMIFMGHINTVADPGFGIRAGERDLPSAGWVWQGK